MDGGGGQLSGIEQQILNFIEGFYNAVGWAGVIIMMAIESAAIPLPSELIMPLAGWKLIEARGKGVEWVLLAGFFGAIGNTIGSWIAYYAGLWAGRPIIEKYGKYILVSRHDLDLADRFFERWGKWAVFGGRLLPVVRTFISVPAGISRVPIWEFTVYTFAGAFIWSTALAYGGFALGKNYESLRAWMRPFDIPIVVVTALAVAWYVYRHIRRAWWERQPEATPASKS